MANKTTIDINHPYFMSSVDHPGLALVTEPLPDKNYHQWNRSIKIALSAKLKIGFIDGTQAKPADSSPQLILWMRNNDLVISWLLNSMSTDIRKSVVYLSTTKQIWDDLEARYAQSNVPRLFHLKKDLLSLTQGTKSITSYFTMFRSLIDELGTLAPIPKCICLNSNCTCGNRSRLEVYEQVNKMSQFLMGLSEQFTTVRGQILLMNPLPDITQAYSMLLQEESQREFASQSVIPVENVAMNVKLNNNFKAKNNKKSPDPNISCEYCHLPGHLKDKCFALHSYPEWHRLQGQPKPKPKNLRKPNANATVMHTEAENREATTGKEMTHTLFENQYQQLMSLLHQNQNNNSNVNSNATANASWINSSTFRNTMTQCAGMPISPTINSVSYDNSAHIWILDSGASHHITPHMHILQNLHEIHSELLLPNGHQTAVTHIGTVKITPDITLKYVLYVPKF